MNTTVINDKNIISKLQDMEKIIDNLNKKLKSIVKKNGFSKELKNKTKKDLK
jgi:hypothetical protein